MFFYVSSTGSHYLLQSKAFRKKSRQFVEELGYEITKKIGSGGFGTVFETSNRKIVKAMDISVRSNINEIMIVQRFNHKNVAKVSPR